MIIALDFDRTLFDRDKMYESSKENAELKNINDPNDFKKKFNEFIENGTLDMDPKEFLYPDVLPFLEKYKDQKLILVTTVGYSSQKKVVTGTGILDYFTDVHFVNENSEKGDILSTFKENVIFLDDLPDNLYDVQSKCKNSTVVLMDRNNVAKNKDFPIVSTLEEFEKFIQ